ncbi:hypothetical protein RI367_005645 [Sorochytrium milnesiophthora]
MIGNSIAFFAFAALLSQTAHAHFTITGPAFSREKQAYPNDNRRFWPIAGGATLRPLNDCLLYPRGQVASLSAGQALTVPFEIGNNARHVGMCTASLINLSSGAQTDLGQELNCVHDHDAMQLTLPQQSCANCVIKIKVTAVHLGPDHPEFYDSCLDVNIGGGGDAPAPAPAKPQPPVTPPNLSNPAPVPAPAPAPALPSDGNGDDNGGDDGNGDDNGGDDGNGDDNGGDDNGGDDNGNNGDNNNTPAPQQPSPPAQPSTGGSCQDGAMSCSADGTQFIQCVNGQQVAQPVAPGTECTTKLTGSPIIAYKGA